MSIKNKTLNHYDNMIQYIKLKDPEDEISRYDMGRDIGTDWFGKNCPYCKQFWYKEYQCGKCPLLGSFNRCCNGLWTQMNLQIFCGEWIIEAKKVKEYIKKHG